MPEVIYDTVDRTQLIQGHKADAGKDRLELIPPEVIFAYGRILTFGAVKYSARNWEKGMTWGRLFGALMRHMWAWWGGQKPTSHNFALGELDTETGMSHLWHAQFCIGCLIAYEERGMFEYDDRFGGKACATNQD